MMLSFLVLSGVMWTTLGLYDEYAARGEARALAKELADQIALVGSMNPGYTSLSRSIPLPSDVHGASYLLTIDGRLFQVRIEIIGPKKAMGEAFFPASVVYHENKRILFLRGFDSIGDGNLVGSVAVNEGGMLIVRLVSNPGKTLIIEAAVNNDEVHQ